MKKIIMLFILFLFAQPAYSYEFDSKIFAKVIEFPEDFPAMDSKLRLQITESVQKEGKNPFPVGSIIELSLTSRRRASYYDNPKIFTNLSSIKLPNGTMVDESYDKFEIKPISGIKSYWIPFYRVSKLFGSREGRTVKVGSILVIKPTKSKNVIAVLHGQEHTN
jgi:hypothetical protein